ncbi:hypothetical protein BDR04DRAFT_844965 [Suillus decipiens]|nr:hypothetical protein BDR04DRAFT_844965 [Suillus decipiens]
MIMALVAPELIVTWAMRQWLSAHQVTRQFKKSGYYPSVHAESEENESVEVPEVEQCGNRLVHLLTVLAKCVLSMLLFLWGFPGALMRWVKVSIKAYCLEQSEDYTWTQTHSFFVLMGGFMLYVDKKPYHTLQPDEVLKLICAGCIDAPILTANQIEDRNKGNAISKGLVILQVAWFVMQLITRAIYHLETTQLETGTLAFVVLNFITYALWWNKPLNVQCPHPVHWKSTESRPEDHIPNLNQRDKFGPLWSLVQAVFGPIPRLMCRADTSESTSLNFGFPTVQIVSTVDRRIVLDAVHLIILSHAALLMATVFGGIHCIAWFFAFPTYQEQVLWRMSAVAITCAPLLSIITFILQIPNLLLRLCYLTVSHLTDLLFPHSRFPLGPITSLYAILYITARAVLLVLMFTTLRSLPPDAYKAVSWTSLMPHL